MEREGDLIFANADHFRTMEKAAGNDIENLARLRAQHAGEVRGLIADERGGSSLCIPGVGDPAAARHGLSLAASRRVSKSSRGCVRIG